MYLENNKLDIIFGSRYQKNSGSEDDTIITLLGNKIFSIMGTILFSLRINDILYTYVLGKTKRARILNLKFKDFRFCIELPIKAKKKGFKLVNSKSYERSRIGGKKKVNALKDGFLILIEIVTLFFRYKIFRNQTLRNRRWRIYAAWY